MGYAFATSVTYLANAIDSDVPSELFASCRMQFADKTTLGQSAVFGVGIFDVSDASVFAIAVKRCVNRMLRTHHQVEFISGSRAVEILRFGQGDENHALFGVPHAQVIDAQELLGLGQRRAGHAGELGIEPEEVLEGDCGQGLALVGDGDALLGLDGLMEALVIPAAVHQAACELIDDDDLAVLDHIVDIPLHNAPGLHGLDGLALFERQGVDDCPGQRADELENASTDSRRQE